MAGKIEERKIIWSRIWHVREWEKLKKNMSIIYEYIYKCINLPSVLRTHISAVERRTCRYVLVLDCPIFHSQRRYTLCCRQKTNIRVIWQCSHKDSRSKYSHGSTASTETVIASRTSMAATWNHFMLFCVVRGEDPCSCWLSWHRIWNQNVAI